MNQSKDFSRDYIRNTTAIYKEASELKKQLRYNEAASLYFLVIERCSGCSAMRKIKGGAYYHLALIAEEKKERQFCCEFLKNALKLYPEHSNAKLMLKNIIAVSDVRVKG